MIKKLMMLFVAGFVLTGCADAGNNDLDSVGTPGQATSSMQVASSLKAEDAISVTISVMDEGKVIEEGTKNLEIEEGTTLLKVMKSNYDVEDDNDFITSIDGYEQDVEANKYWLFRVNGKDSVIGAHEIELQEGDLVEFNLEGTE